MNLPIRSSCTDRPARKPPESLGFVTVFKRAHRSLVTWEYLVLLHLLTPRAFARAPVQAFVSVTTIAVLACAGLVTSAPARQHPEQPDLALTAAPAAVTVAPAPLPITVSTPRPLTADLTCLAKAVYYEARGESEEGQAAVAQVVLNRTHRREYAHSVCGVVFQGAHAGQCQFSFACNGAMDRPLETTAWTRARRIALAVISGERKAPVGEAVSFHTASEGGRGRAVAHIGGHLFFDAARA